MTTLAAFTTGLLLGLGVAIALVLPLLLAERRRADALVERLTGVPLTPAALDEPAGFGAPPYGSDAWEWWVEQQREAALARRMQEAGYADPPLGLDDTR